MGWHAAAQNNMGATALLARENCWENAVPGCPLVIQGTTRSEALELQQEVKSLGRGRVAETINVVQ